MLREFVQRSALRVAPKLVNRRRLKRGRLYEAELALIPILCDPRKVSLDVGANYGLYTHHCLDHSRAVIAFEPLPSMQDFLRRCYKTKITLHPCALSSEDGSAEIRLPKKNTSWASIEASNTLAGSSDERIDVFVVPTRRLDGFDLRDVGFIKIDVEGHEEAVVRGGRETIIRERPILLIEVEQRHNPGSVGRLVADLTGLGYDAFFIDGGRLKPYSAFDLSRDQNIANVGEAGKHDRYINNFIFSPRERSEQFRRMAPLSSKIDCDAQQVPDKGA